MRLASVLKKYETCAGLKIYDIANREKSKEIAFYQPTPVWIVSPSTAATPTFSTHIEGSVGRIPLILDLKDSTKPEEVDRWLSGQWTAGGDLRPNWRSRSISNARSNPVNRKRDWSIPTRCRTS
jgi:hypothetical protein